MTQQRSNDDIRADVKYLNDHEAQTGRRSSAHVLLTHDVEPLLARVSELEQERDELREQYTVTAGYYSMYYDMRARAERAEADATGVRNLNRVAAAAIEEWQRRAFTAEARVRAVERLHVWTNEDGRRFVFADDLAVALEIPGAAPAGLSLQEERE